MYPLLNNVSSRDSVDMIVSYPCIPRDRIHIACTALANSTRTCHHTAFAIMYSTIRHSGVVTKKLRSYSDGMNTDETSVTDVKTPNLTEGSSHSVPRVP